MGYAFFVASFKGNNSLAHSDKSIGKKRGLAITLARAIIASPHSHEEESSWYP
jgi:hypothetical protein